MRRFWIIGLAALFVLGIAGVVAAAPGFGWGGGPATAGSGFFGGGLMGWMHGADAEPRILDAGLNLTDEQAQAINDLHNEKYTQMQALREDLLQLRNEYHDAVTSGDTTRAEDLRNQLLDAQQQMIDLQDQNREQVQQVLTDEQREQLNDDANDIPCPMGGFGPRGGAGFRGGRGMGAGRMGGFGPRGY